MKTSLSFLGMKLDSNIVQGNDFFIVHLSLFMEPVVGSNPNWKLCYRASSHGWAASTFHSNCDGKRHTITIIRKAQYVFGGYVDIPWGINLIRKWRNVRKCLGRVPESEASVASLRTKYKAKYGRRCDSFVIISDKLLRTE